ncbi:MAG TPA: DNA mismatch repair protein MutS [Methanothrix sp.]|nr:DNA mismatch repair protein MutS [Methanothrix sp.]
MKLLDLPGVGSRMRERLVEQYGDEEKALQAVRDGDVSGLTRALSERQALLLVQHMRAQSFGANPEQFTATDEATGVRRMLLTKMAEYAHTDYARLKMGTLFPSACPALVAESRRTAEQALFAAERLKGSGLAEHLRKVRPLREKAAGRVRERAVAAASVEDFAALKARGLDRLIDLHLTESAAEIADLARGYSQVTLVGGEGMQFQSWDGLAGQNGIEPAQSLEEWYLVPEAALAFFNENLESLTAAAGAARLIAGAGIEGCGGSFGQEGWQELEALLKRLKGGSDREVERLGRIAGRLAACAGDAAAWANEELKGRIEKSSLTLGGSDLLMAMSRGEAVRELIEARMRGVYAEVLAAARGRAVAELELEGAEAARLEEVFPSEFSYPLELDRQALHAFEREIAGRGEERGLKAKRELARALQYRKQAAEEMVRAVMEFDFLYALGSFALDENLAFPEIAEEACLSFEQGRHLFLKEAEPVSYALGGAGHEEKVALLSGVNSGGKTTLLDLIAQIAILAHMGLPVPAGACRIGLFQEFYYFSKSRGTLSAGAFETAMRKFSVVENEKRKLVLADELEAITEPGASARIIACMLDELNRRECAAVFVSHLAEDVHRYTETAVRVDGIAAEGLDENNNLRVSRSPRYNYLAKSTPELILDRLVRSTEGREKEFYARLLAKFR